MVSVVFEEPVLPPAVYVLRNALRPVPDRMTRSIIRRMVIAVSGRMIRTGSTTSAFSTGPPGRCVLITSCGVTSDPPFAITAAACASCSVVVAQLP